MPRKSHKQVVKDIRDLVLMAGGQAWVLSQSGRLYGSAGLPDIYCVVGERAFWVEAKAEGDSLRDSQQTFKAASETAGVPVVVGRAGDVADFLGLT